MSPSRKIVSELRQIAAKSKGLLVAEKVVIQAKNPASSMHNYIWGLNQAKAAWEYRILQAERLIRHSVECVEINGERKVFRVFVSLTPDRKDGAGYREIVAVLSNKGMRAQMLEDALNELAAFQIKYENLTELSEVFAVSRKLRDSMRKK